MYYLNIISVCILAYIQPVIQLLSHAFQYAQINCKCSLWYSSF